MEIFLYIIGFFILLALFSPTSNRRNEPPKKTPKASSENKIGLFGDLPPVVTRSSKESITNLTSSFDSKIYQDFLDKQETEKKKAARKAAQKREHERSLAENRAKAQAAKNPEPKKEAWQIQEDDNESMRKAEPLKARGDGYELFIGRKFEEKQDLVIYNGFMKSFEDQGVDLVVLSKPQKSVYLIQCKNWQRFEFTTEHLFKIYRNLTLYKADYFDVKPEALNHYLSIPFSANEITSTITSSRDYQVRKVLYLASKAVINNNVFEHLEEISPTIYRHKDMKIVIQPVKH